MYIRKNTIVGICIILLLLSQCNWYVQYQPYKTVAYQELPQIVKDSVEVVNTRYILGVVDEHGFRVHSQPKLIATDGEYLFITKYYTWSPAGGSWGDYNYIINLKTKIKNENLFL